MILIVIPNPLENAASTRVFREEGYPIAQVVINPKGTHKLACRIDFTVSVPYDDILGDVAVTFHMLRANHARSWCEVDSRLHRATIAKVYCEGHLRHVAIYDF